MARANQKACFFVFFILLKNRYKYKLDPIRKHTVSGYKNKNKNKNKNKKNLIFFNIIINITY